MTVAAGRVVVRPAEPADGVARCELFARVTMETDLGLSVRRDPDFDALYRLQSQDCMALVVEHDGRVEGTGTVVIRDGYIAGERRRVGYLGDLRLSPTVQGRFLLDRFYGSLLEDVHARFGCELFLTAVIASNARALRALTVRTARAQRARMPVYTPLGDFDIRSILLLAPPRIRPGGVAVRQATDADIPAIARLLDEDGRRRPFGFVFTEAELRRRLREWPGLAVDSFLVAEAGNGAIVGCLALWDAAPVKRMVVTSYRGRLRRTRVVHDVLARLLGRSRLPAEGQRFDYRYVTHVAVPTGDAQVLRALLRRACANARAARCHFVSVCAPAGSAVDNASRGLAVTNLPARLFVVALPGVDVSAVTSAREWPGFEMALA